MAVSTDSSEFDRSSQLLAHGLGTILMGLFIPICYLAGFSPRSIDIVLVFVLAEVSVLVLCFWAAFSIDGNVWSRLKGAARRRRVSRTHGGGSDPGLILVIIGVVTIASVTYITAVTGGIDRSPFSPFILIAIVFGQSTAEHVNRVIKETLAAGLLSFGLLLALSLYHIPSGSVKIETWVYFASVSANLLFASLLNYIQSLASDD